MILYLKDPKNSPNFIKHTLKDLKTYINFSMVLVGDFHTPYHQLIGHSNKKINKEILEINLTIDQMD
jgi:hypothetical protein